MTTIAPHPVSLPTTDTPSRTSASPTSPAQSGNGRKVFAGLAATLLVAGGIGAYLAVNTTGTASTTPATTARPITSGGVDVIERSAPAQSVTSGGVDVIERSTVRRSPSTDRPDVTEQAIPASATVTSGGVDVTERSAPAQSVTSGGVDVIERQGCSVQCVAAQFRLEKRTK